MAGYYAPAQGNGSLTVNGQIVPMPMTGAFFPPMAAAPRYSGNGQPPPTVPINYMGSVGGLNAQAADKAASMPFSFVHSPLMISVFALIIGILGLRYVHWRG